MVIYLKNSLRLLQLRLNLLLHLWIHLQWSNLLKRRHAFIFLYFTSWYGMNADPTPYIFNIWLVKSTRNSFNNTKINLACTTIPRTMKRKRHPCRSTCFVRGARFYELCLIGTAAQLKVKACFIKNRFLLL